MPLPRSTFVMGAAAMALLVMAIRGTVTRGHVATVEEQEEAQARAAYEADQASQAKEAEADAERRRLGEERDDLMDWTRKLVGAEVATFGGPFAGMTLPIARADTFTARSRASVGDFARVELASFGATQTVDRIAIHPAEERGPTLRRQACDALERELSSAWGNGVGTEWEDKRTWTNAPRRMRATFSRNMDGCTLSFDHALAVDAWVAQSALIGQRHDQLPAWTQWDTDETARLTMPGVGGDDSLTEVTLEMRAGRVVGISARVSTDAATRAAIAAEVKRVSGAKLTTARSMLALTRGDAP